MPQDVLDREANSALNTQVGGGHYKDMKIQPVVFIHANGLGFFEGNVVKYVSRWRAKGGVDDLRKARHYLDLLIEMETPKDPAMNAVAMSQGHHYGGMHAPDAHSTIGAMLRGGR